MEKVRLTIVDKCCNPECENFVYAELREVWDDEACFECVPPRLVKPEEGDLQDCESESR